MVDDSSLLLARQIISDWISSSSAQPIQSNLSDVSTQNKTSGSSSATAQPLGPAVEACLGRELKSVTLAILQEAKKSMIRCKRKTLLTQDVTNALKAKGLNHFYYVTAAENTYPNLRKKDQMIDVNDLIAKDNEQLIEIDMTSPSIHAHWLCVDGVQPMVSENPSYSMIDEESDETIGNVDTNNALSKGHINSSNNAVEGLKFLSYEQQLLFSQITEMCVGSSDEKRNLAISSLAKDPGFEDIIPHLVSFVTEGVRMNVNEQNMVSLIYLMRMVDSFVSNPNINIEHYLHDIIPSVLTCVITKTLYKKQDDNHWALRDYSAKLITVICKKFSDSYNNYHAQIYGLISEIISSDNYTKHTWNAKYGAIKILCELGSNSLKVYMLPKLKFLSDQMVDHLDSSEIEALAQKAIKKIWNTLQNYLGNKIFWEEIGIEINLERFNKDYGSIGNDLYEICMSKEVKS